MKTTDNWLAWAGADADARALPELKPLLAALAGARRALRAADWNEDASRDPRAAVAAPAAPTGDPADRVDAEGARP
jgi:hypothetical protein